MTAYRPCLDRYDHYHVERCKPHECQAPNLFGACKDKVAKPVVVVEPPTTRPCSRCKQSYLMSEYLSDWGREVRTCRRCREYDKLDKARKKMRAEAEEARLANRMPAPGPFSLTLPQGEPICNECGKPRPLEAFRSPYSNRLTKICQGCRDRVLSYREKRKECQV